MVSLFFFCCDGRSALEKRGDTMYAEELLERCHASHIKRPNECTAGRLGFAFFFLTQCFPLNPDFYDDSVVAHTRRAENGGVEGKAETLNFWQR